MLGVTSPLPDPCPRCSPQLLGLEGEVVHVAANAGVTGVHFFSLLCLFVTDELTRILTHKFTSSEGSCGHNTTALSLHLHYLAVATLSD